MRDYAGPDEVAELLSENTEGAHKAVTAVHALLEGKDLDPLGDVDSLDFLRRLVSEHLPIRRIVDGVVLDRKSKPYHFKLPMPALSDSLLRRKESLRRKSLEMCLTISLKTHA